MLGSVAHESEILTQVLALRDDPVGFAHYAYPWGAPGTPFEKGLRVWQAEELKRLGDHVVEQSFRFANDLPLKVYRRAWSSGRGPGKSAGFGMIAHWHASTHVGAPTLVAANTESQLRTRTFPEFAVWFGSSINSHWWTTETLRITPAPWLLELVRKPTCDGGLGRDPKYWYVQGQTWSEDNPNSFAGAHNPYGMLVLFDEASGIPSAIWDVTRGFFTEVNPYRFHLAASQMRNRQGRFFEVFNDKLQGAEWGVRTISTRGMDGIDQAELEAAIKTYGADSDYVRVEIDGLPPQTSEDQFIPWDNVRAAQQNDLNRDEGEPLILGVDPAPRGKTSWRFRQGRNARDCCGGATHGSWLGYDNVQIAEQIVKLNDKYDPDAICVDFGMGTGVIDVLKRNTRIRHKLHEVKFGDTAHDKATEWATHAIELWALLRAWLPGGMVERDEGEKGTLSQQLTDRGWRWSGREDNKKILETKDDLQRRGVKSPDDGDALACTFEVNPPRRGTVPGQREARIAHGVEPSMFDAA
jgi:hypothetical protein